MIKGRGFTLFEMVISIGILGIIAIPATMTVLEYVRSLEHNKNVALTSNLTEMEFASVNNLNFNDVVSAQKDDYLGSGFDMSRGVEYVGGTDNKVKSVNISLYPAGFGYAPGARAASADTYASEWSATGFGSAGGPPSGEEMDFFQIPVGGSIIWTDLLGPPITILFDFEIRNARTTGNITLTAIEMYTDISDLYFGAAEIDSRTIYHYDRSPSKSFVNISTDSGSPTRINLQKTFMMGSGAQYGLTRFYFLDPGKMYSLYVRFIFYDETTTSYYIWSYSP